MTVLPDTFMYLYDSISNIYDMGIKNIELELDFNNKNWTQEIIEAYITELKKIADYVVSQKKIGETIYIPLLEYAQGKPKNSICSGGKTSFAISPNGNIYPCSFSINIEKFQLGNINGVFNYEILNEIESVANIKNNGCVGCSRYDYCITTRCKIINYVYTGNYFTPLPVMCANENIKVSIGKYSILAQ
jgi:uncharacterized protein